MTDRNRFVFPSAMRGLATTGLRVETLAHLKHGRWNGRGIVEGIAQPEPPHIRTDVIMPPVTVRTLRV